MLLTVNGRKVKLPESSGQEPLLWVLREELGLTGSKFGCGQGICGACTIHLDGTAARSCLVTTAEASGKAIVTVEGLADPATGELHPVQQAWMAENVPQCGYCQAGQIMGAAALLREKPHPDDADIDAAMAGHLCRCGTYQRIRRAIHRAADIQEARR